MGTIFSPTDYDDWRWAGSAVNPPGAPSPATLTDINSTGVYAYVFINNSVLAFHDLQLPHSYKEDTDLVPHIHWAPTTTATYTGTWTLEWIDWLSVADGTALQAKTTVTAAFNTAMTAYQMQTQNFSANMSGTGRKISSIVHAKLTLALSAGAGCILGGLDCHFEKDRLGSKNITSKA